LEPPNRNSPIHVQPIKPEEAFVESTNQIREAADKFGADWGSDERVSITGSRYVCGKGIFLLVTVVGEVIGLPTEVELNDGTTVPVAYDHRSKPQL
jgi:hypothetical protein